MKDEAIEEIREVRHRISAECGHDPQRYYAHLEEVAVRYAGQIASWDELEQRRREQEGASPRVAEEP